MCAMPWSLRTVPVPVQAPGLHPVPPRASASRAPLWCPMAAAPVALSALPGLVGRSRGSCGSRRQGRIRCRAQVEWLNLSELSELSEVAEPSEPSEPRSAVLVEPRSEVVELPVMPLNAVYLPSPSQQLMISEPRYLKLFDDILVNGSRMFAVCHCRGSLLARVGLVFRLTDLKDVAQETNGHTRYVAEHEVRQRVRILSVLNPEDQESKSEYLRAKVQFLEDPEEDTVPEELRVILQRILKFWFWLAIFCILVARFEVLRSVSDTEWRRDSSQSTCFVISGIRGKLQDALAIQGEQEQGDPEELGNQARRLRLASVIRRWVLRNLKIIGTSWPRSWFPDQLGRSWFHSDRFGEDNGNIRECSIILKLSQVGPLQEPRLLGPLQHVGLHSIPPFATGDPSLAAAREATHRSGSVGKLQPWHCSPSPATKSKNNIRVCIEYGDTVLCWWTVPVEIWWKYG